MARVQTMVQLSDDLVRMLDGEVARRGLSRSAVIREVLEESLADERAAEIGRRIAEGYRRIPPATPDEWGDIAAQTDAATADALHKLDAEERAQGHPAW